MEISGTFSMNVGKVQIPSNEANDGQQIYVDGEIKVTPEMAEKQFGTAFHYVAFATMHDQVVPGGVDDEGDATITRFGYDSKKVPKWLVPSLHTVDLWGQKQKTQPEIQKIIAGDDEEAVTLKVRFVFDTSRDEKLIGALGAMSGKVAKVKIKAVQTAAIGKAAPATKAA